MKIPSSSSQKERDKILQNRVVHVKRPDLTNLQKFLEDCLKGIVIHDDSQVYHHEATKHYGETPCSIVNIFM
jgi:Holliday junction resolvase RusA-like endonuclease